MYKSELAQSSKGALHTKSYFTYFPLPSNKSRRYTTLIFLNPVTSSRITRSGITKSLEVRFLIVWPNLNHFDWFFYYLHTSIRRNYMVFFQLFFFLCRTIRLKLGSSLIYLIHLHTITRQKYMISFHLFCFCARLFDQILGSSLICFFLFVHDHSTKAR